MLPRARFARRMMADEGRLFTHVGRGAYTVIAAGAAADAVGDWRRYVVGASDI